MIITRKKQIIMGISCVGLLALFLLTRNNAAEEVYLSEQEVKQGVMTVDSLLAAVKSVNMSTCCSQSQSQDLPLLTLFTTMKPVAAKRSLYSETLRNWALFHPHIVSILYTTDEDDILAPLVQEALRYNWKVYRAPEIWNGLPVLRAMFSHAINISNSSLYGYANGDILFANNFIQTLSYVRHVNWTQYLVTGRRTNINYNGSEVFDTMEDVLELAKTKGTLFFPAAQDYFISTADGYPWESMPRFVVGRVAFDNWIVANGLIKRIPVIDATETIVAVHLTDFEGKEAGRYAINKTDVMRNSKLIARNFFIQLGSVSCALFVTKWNDQLQHPLITTRQITDKPCKRGYKRYKLYAG